MAENPDDLQTALNTVSQYCKNWYLTVNATKTKGSYFHRDGSARNHHSILMAKLINEYVYF